MNYDEAITVFKRRFGNKQQIISRHTDTLVTVNVDTGKNNDKALRQLYDALESNVQSLKSLGVPDESYGSLIVGRRIGDDDWNLDPQRS